MTNKNETRVIERKKHNALRKRVEYYKKYHGLSYVNADSDKKTSYLNNITYKCLKCGKLHTTDLETACSYKFNCDECVNKNSKLKNKVNKKGVKSYYNMKDFKLPFYSFNDAEIKLDNLDNPDELEDRYIKIVIIPLPEKPTTKKKGLFSWIKNLLHIK